MNPNKTNFLGRFAALALMLMSWGCQSLIIAPPSGPEPVWPPDPSPSAEAPGDESPQLHASVTLTQKGKSLLEEGRVDAAIREFERAVSLNPHHGPGYYFLASAWMQKGNFRQAKSFHQLAELHLQNQSGWDARLRSLGAEIQRRSKSGSPGF